MRFDAATGLYLASSRWYDPQVGRFLTSTGSGDGGGYAYVPDNPMDLANGFTSRKESFKGDNWFPSYWGYFTDGWGAQFTRALGEPARWSGNLTGDVFDYLAESTSNPYLAGALSFEAEAGRFMGNMTGSIPDFYGNVAGAWNGIVSGYETFISHYSNAGGGAYGTLSGLSGATGVSNLAESFVGYDILTGEKLSGDERFDRGILGAGAAGGITLSIVGAGQFASAHLAKIAPKVFSKLDIFTSRIELTGAARGPTVPYRRSRNFPRGTNAAIRELRSLEVEIPDYVSFRRVPDDFLDITTDAKYLDVRRMNPGTRITWKQLLDPEGKLPVYIKRSVFLSDDNIIGAVLHELHEITNLKKLFDQNGGWLRADTVFAAINELHLEAWDISNRAVLSYQRTGVVRIQ